MVACDDTGDSGKQLELDSVGELDASSHSTNSRPLLLRHSQMSRDLCAH